tara:strand:- start:424 stop:678 length:255 start_codon:yes stop_codon:yes gene_type:complete
MKPQTKRHHLMSGIPNNFLTRWLVKKANQRMAKANSMYRLRMRYRKAKVGKATYWGDVSKDNAKQFSLYLRLPEGYDLRVNRYR